MTHHLYLLPRGVHLAPVLGPHNERIFFAVNSRHQAVNTERVMVPPGENPEPAMQHLWDMLNRADPLPAPTFPVQLGSTALLLFAVTL